MRRSRLLRTGPPLQECRGQPLADRFEVLLDHPLGKDRITSRYERPVGEIFAAAKQVLSVYGTLTSENTIANTLEAKVDQNTVYVKVDAVEPNVSQLTVQARTKGGMANIDLASEVDKRIALQLK